MHCGTKNPDGAKFCNNCGKVMGTAPTYQSSPAGQTPPVNRTAPVKTKTTKKAGGMLKRLVISFFVFLVFYSVGYGASSLFTDTKSNDKKSSAVDTNQFHIDPIQPEITIKPETSVQPVVPAQPETGYTAALNGYWEQVNLVDGNFNLNVNAMSFYETVYDCTGLTVNMDVTMNAGTSCKDWQVWARSGNTFVKIGKIYLPAGDGYVSQVLVFPDPVTFDSIAVTPTIVGGYSWSMGLSITDVYSK